MSTRIRRKTYFMRSVVAGTDKVLGAAFLPPGGVLHAISGAIHVVTVNAMTVVTAAMFGLSGWMVEGFDPDTSDSVDDIYDRMVPKDEDVNPAAGVDQIDMDSTTPNISSEFEPGEPTVEAMVGLMPAGKFWDEEVLLSFANSKGGFDKVLEDSLPTYLWDPFLVKPRMRAETQAMAALSFANPAQDDVTGSIMTSPAGTKEWVSIQFIDDVLEDAWKQMVGLTESGAESPFSDMAEILQGLVEPTVVEEVAGSFSAETYRVWAALHWDFSVPGTHSKIQVSSG